MDLEYFWTQVVIATAKEGISFIYSLIKDQSERDKKEEQDQNSAEEIAAEKFKEDVSKHQNIDWSKIATLYWLGNDLMWIQDMMFRGAYPERVIQGLNHALKYCSDLGFDEKSFPIQQLIISKTFLDPVKDLLSVNENNIQALQNQYQLVNQNVTSIKWYLNALLENQEPGFEKLRAL